MKGKSESHWLTHNLSIQKAKGTNFILIYFDSYLWKYKRR